VIKAMFGDGGALDNTGKFARSSTWTTIVRECGNLSSKGINLLSHMKRKVGNGLNTLFWVDSWLTDIPLKQLYPRMFALDCNKNSTVAKKINVSSISCSFRRPPRGSLEEEQFSKLIEDVNSVILSVSNDRWIWSLDSSGEFLIKSTRLFIDDHLLLAVSAPTRWVSEVPIKINIMAWKVSLDKLPTRLNLSLQGIESCDKDIQGSQDHSGRIDEERNGESMLWPEVAGKGRYFKLDPDTSRRVCNDRLLVSYSDDW
ncbi:hypothetical protein Tco_1391057, partial [Tanacetum coccineum]